jgi:predicted transcriptional regulator
LVYSKETPAVSDKPAPMLLELAAQIVSAHVSHNPLPADALSPLITTVIKALAGAGTQVEAAKREPAVPTNKSVFAGHIVCLECGKHFSTLKRHLRTEHDLTPEAYRAKWGLSGSYPFVAVDYAKRRSALAKQLGLGTKTGAGRATRQTARAAKRGRPRNAAWAMAAPSYVFTIRRLAMMLGEDEETLEEIAMETVCFSTIRPDVSSLP